ncbi:MAG: TRAP transporter large permease [Desulfobacterales bacterium]|nr:MAG: TRAP transporter large permease [Desulfobacterales bacterium]
MASIVLLLVTLITLVIGMPIVFSIGIAAVCGLLVIGEIPLQFVPQRIYAGMDSFPLLCIPFFILAGELMSHGKITERLLEFAIIVIGRIRGGLALANVLASMFFGGMTGSAIADASALGSVEIPMMVKSGYDKEFSAAVTCASAMVGPLIPPSILVVIYALSGGVSIGGLFLAGIIPGVLVGLALMVASYIISVKRKYPIREEKVGLKDFIISFRRVILPLFLPIIIVGGIISGIFTPTEASAVAVGYAFVVTVIITRKIKIADLPDMLIHSGVITAIVMIIVGTATVFGAVISLEQLGDKLGALLRFAGPLSFLAITNVFLLILGTFVDNVPMILIFAPTLAPIAVSLGIHPLHYGMLFVINCTLAMITPPLGNVLFVACPIAGISMESLSREIFVLFLIEVGVLFLITYIPFTTLWIPELFGFL